MPPHSSVQRVSNYWSQFEDFTPDPEAGVVKEFARLALVQKWGKKSKKFREERSRCLHEEFTFQYDTAKPGKLQGWKALCEEVGIEPVPETVTKCKKALKGVWVNLVDLIDSRWTGTKVPTHPSKRELRSYSRENGKIFPLNAAKKDGFISALLINM